MIVKFAKKIAKKYKKYIKNKRKRIYIYDRIYLSRMQLSGKI